MGHRTACPLGNVEAMPYRASSVWTTRIIYLHLIRAERYFRDATQSQLRTIANDAHGRCRHVANRGYHIGPLSLAFRSRRSRDEIAIAAASQAHTGGRRPFFLADSWELRL